MNITFRYNVKVEDIFRVREIVESTKFFYDIEIPIAVELVSSAASGYNVYKFIFAEIDGEVVAYSCYGKIDGTVGGYDLYWIVTHNDYRGSGIGKQLIE